MYSEQKNRTELFMYKRFIVILICAAVLFSTGSAVLAGTQSASEETVGEELYVTQINSGKIQAVLASNDGGYTVFYNLATGIYPDGVPDNELSAYSQTSMISFVVSMSHLPAVKEMENDTGEYGFDSPRSEVIILTDDDTVRLTLGRISPISGESYLRAVCDSDGIETLWLISEEYADMMRLSLKDFRKLDMFPAISSSNISSLQALRIGSSEGSFTLQQIESDTISTFFAMVEPVEIGLNWETVYRKIITNLYSLMPDRFVSDDVPLSEYGLDAPEYTLDLFIDGYGYSCGFVRKDPSSWYCANLNSTLVSEISAEKVEFLATGYLELIGTSLYSLSAADASAVTASFTESDGRSRTVSVEVSGFSENLCAVAGEKQLDKTETTELFSRLTSLPAVAVVPQNEDITSAPLLTLTFSLRDGNSDIIELVPLSGGRQCAVFINGQADFSTYTTIVNDIISTLENTF